MAVSVRPFGAAAGSLAAASVPRSALAAECAAALLLLGLIGMGAARAWSFYETTLAPLRRPTAVLTQERTVRRDDREAVERVQLVQDLLGEASVYRAAKRYEWAEETLARALALDPAHPEARKMRDAWEATPPEPLSPEEVAARERETRLYELLGAAISLLEAEDAAPAALAEARGYVDEALGLAPGHPTARALAARLGAGE